MFFFCFWGFVSRIFDEISWDVSDELVGFSWDFHGILR